MNSHVSREVIRRMCIKQRVHRSIELEQGLINILKSMPSNLNLKIQTDHRKFLVHHHNNNNNTYTIGAIESMSHNQIGAINIGGTQKHVDEMRASMVGIIEISDVLQLECEANIGIEEGRL